MKISANNKFWLFTILLLLLVPLIALRINAVRSTSEKSARQSLASLPPLILWAWERPDKLGFIDPGKVGVAFLAASIHLRGEDVLLKPRLQPLQTPEETKLVAVVRIDTDRIERPQLTSNQLQRTTSELIAIARQGKVMALQIDFDATVSERSFYRDLLFAVRRQLPTEMPLSITALASWCAGDNWIDDLPIDEAVPMLFRMGVEQKQFESRLQQGYKFSGAPCKASAGVSTDQPIKRPPVQRLYIFNPNPWSEPSLNNTLEVYKP